MLSNKLARATKVQSAAIEVYKAKSNQGASIAALSVSVPDDRAVPGRVWCPGDWRCHGPKSRYCNPGDSAASLSGPDSRRTANAISIHRQRTCWFIDFRQLE